MLENGQPLESLLKTENPEFKVLMDELKQNSFQSQIDYLERVFSMIDRNEEDVITQCLKRNKKSSYEWCVRFTVPINQEFNTGVT